MRRENGATCAASVVSANGVQYTRRRHHDPSVNTTGETSVALESATSHDRVAVSRLRACAQRRKAVAVEKRNPPVNHVPCRRGLLNHRSVGRIIDGTATRCTPSFPAQRVPPHPARRSRHRMPVSADEGPARRPPARLDTGTRRLGLLAPRRLVLSASARVSG